MSDLSDLYQEVILDHYRSPRNFKELTDPDRSAEGYNPLCGDRLKVFLRLEGDTVQEATFMGSGCAISQASTSVMTAAVRGKTRAEIEALFKKFQALVTGQTPDVDLSELGELAAMSGVSQFPVRVKCATLGWHTTLAALKQQRGAVSTE